MKEATARIKINKLLEAAGWRFLAEVDQPANIQLEPSVKPIRPLVPTVGILWGITPQFPVRVRVSWRTLTK